jgi:V/A-type H+/Na+-transporting ATPase subunit E
MALSHILDKITDDAKKKAALMKQVVDDEVKNIQAEAKGKADARRAEIEEKGTQHGEKMLAKAKTLAVMEGRSELLKEKRMLIDDVYATLEKELTDLDDEAYIALVASMLSHLGKEAEKGHLTVPASRAAQTRKAVDKAGVDYDVKDESSDLKGGFILKSGKVEINLTFKHVIQNLVRPSTELEVAAILFN